MISLRIARPEDAEAVLAIYAPYIENTAITFDYDVPSLEEFRAHMLEIMENYPFIVAEDDGKIVGYTYASTFRAREAYIYTAETSIYIKPEYQHTGIGRLLYEELEKYLIKQNIHTLYACITDTESENDEHLKKGSTLFHANVAYKYIGSMKKCGYKFNKWYDIIWMEKILIEPIDGEKLEFIPFSKL